MIRSARQRQQRAGHYNSSCSSCSRCRRCRWNAVLYGRWMSVEQNRITTGYEPRAVLLFDTHLSVSQRCLMGKWLYGAFLSSSSSSSSSSVGRALPDIVIRT